MRSYVIAILVLSLFGFASCAKKVKGDFAAGLTAYEAKDYALALKEFKPLAEAGNAGAQFKLAEMHWMGHGVAPNAEESLRWCRKAAEQGHAEAQYTLGMHYARGGLVREDHAQAKNWFLKAADQGDTESLGYLAVLFDDGKGVKKDPIAAHALYTLHARRIEAERKSTLISGSRLAAALTPEQISEGTALADKWSVAGTVISKELAKR